MTLTPTQVKGAIDTNIPDNTVGTVTPASMRDTLYTIVDNETGSGGSGGTVGGISSANFIDVTDLISSTTFPTIAEGGPSWVTSRGLTTVGDTPVWNVYFRQNTAPASPWPAVAQRQSVDGSYWVLQPQNGEIWVEQCGAQARPNNDKSFDNWPRFEDAKIVILMSRDQGKTVGTMRIGNGIFYLSKAHSIEGGGYHIRGLSMNNTSFIRCPYNSDGIQIQKSYGSAATFGHEGGAYLSFFDSNKGQEYYNDGIHVYVCTQAGRGSSTGPTGTGTGIVDGAAVFDYVRDLTWAEQRFSGAQEHYTISDLTIWSYWDHTNLSQNDDDVTVPGGGYHSGIVMRSKSTIRDVFTLGFSGHGVAIVADGDPELRGPGNTNGWRIYNLLSNYNQYDGLHIGYSDANAGNIIGLDTAYNGRWGYKDAGFLTNTAIDLQSAFDGNVTGGGQGKYMGTVTHKGYVWLARETIIGIDSSPPNYANEPGFDPISWIRFGGGGIATATDNAPQWDATSRYQPTGCFCTNNINNHSTLINIYIEGGTNPAQLCSPSLVLGGITGSWYDRTRSPILFEDGEWTGPVSNTSTHTGADGVSAFQTSIGSESVDGVANKAKSRIMRFQDHQGSIYRWEGVGPVPQNITGSIADATYTDASFTGQFGVHGVNVLDVTAISSGSIVNGSTVVGAGVPAGVTINSLRDGTPGGIGTYWCNRPYPQSSLSTVSETMTLTRVLGVLTATSVPTNAISLGAIITGTGVAANTQIAAQVNGSGNAIGFTGGTGTYSISNRGQTLSSRTLTITGNNTKNLDYVLFNEAFGQHLFGFSSANTQRKFGTNTVRANVTFLGVGALADIDAPSIDNTVRMYRKNMSGGLPGAGDFGDGEMAINSHPVSGSPSIAMYNKTAGAWFALSTVP
jgi:hypothetical protein